MHESSKITKNDLQIKQGNTKITFFIIILEQLSKLINRVTRMYSLLVLFYLYFKILTL